ncbi:MULTISPECIES: LPXTG cell wall anchor domain-containing protein [Myroides]|uniref:LPXTG cell wall anchor domain-containing protein n=1 Tax=Myroides albus TaxID=2562892 RepID=A0A6I3LG69_9FLAO|nr:MULTISPECIES: LPXTG cell wall anchor domain-containing protein [Myroides]MTG97478.1 LPXTG cell wall anchor domain-containing protein [Myroides albus]MVX34670.1 LPXTG cell wall anchor domain-containing protein [Myroides sp. LoEW2-1]UVD79509.1 LPXTG cell wall anchor domain-containing protein [Myroides albus]
MKRQIILTVSLLTFTTITIAQDDKNSIDKQFTSLLQESTNYQSYKVVPKARLEQLQKNVGDSIDALQSNIVQVNNEMNNQKVVVDSLSNKLVTIQDSLDLALSKENSFEVFGISTQKSTFQTIVWSIIGLLLLSLGIIFFRFRKSNKDTKEALKRLNDTELELEELRRSSLEREQKIRRQLQDEINKSKQV